MWLGIGGGVVVIVVIVIVVGLVAVGKPSTSSGSGSGGTSTSGGQANAAGGPNACALPGNPAGGTGPWKLVEPKTLCDLPLDTLPQDVAAAQESVNSTELVFDPIGGQANPGTYTTAFGVEYQIPSSANFERFINVVGFTGTFNTQAAVSELEQLDENPDIPGNVFKSVPPGPHGGLMGCEPVYSAEECVFGTSTTLGQFTFEDSLNELAGAHSAANAIKIRDALEVPAS
jgi:hypothetical protein